MISFIYKSWSLDCGRLRNSLLNGGAILIDLGSFETRQIFEFWLARGQAATRDVGGAIRESIKDIAFAAMTCWSIRDSKELLSLYLSTKQLTLCHFEFAAFCVEIRGYENWRGGRQVQWVGEGSFCKALGSLRLVTWILREWCIRMHIMISYDLFLSVSKCDIEVDYAPLCTKVSALVRWLLVNTVRRPMIPTSLIGWWTRMIFEAIWYMPGGQGIPTYFHVVSKVWSARSGPIDCPDNWKKKLKTQQARMFKVTAMSSNRQKKKYCNLCWFRFSKQ